VLFEARGGKAYQKSALGAVLKRREFCDLGGLHKFGRKGFLVSLPQRASLRCILPETGRDGIPGYSDPFTARKDDDDMNLSDAA